MATITEDAEIIFSRLERLTAAAQWLADNRDSEMAFEALELLDFIAGTRSDEPTVLQEYAEELARERRRSGRLMQPPAEQLLAREDYH